MPSVAQCGGPTPVINATLAAAVAEWQTRSKGAIYGSRFGFEGCWLLTGSI